MKAVILVGGQGTRLRPLTDTIPKSMLPLVNIPFLEHVLKLLKRYSIEEVILSAGVSLDVFKNYFGDGKEYGLKIIYAKEDEPLGTAGAIKNVEKYLDDSTFVVLNGDILTDLNIARLVEYHKSKKALVTITLASVEDPTPYGLVPIDDTGKVITFLEKPSQDEAITDLINAGTYVLEPEILSFIPEGINYSFEKGVFPGMVKRDEGIFGFSPNVYWLDIGTPQKYLKAHHDVLEGEIELNFEGEQIKPRVWVGEDCEISSEANIFGPVVIGNSCQIEASATIFGHTTIGNNCIVGPGAAVSESVLFDGCKVNGASIVKRSILGRGVELDARVHIEDMVIAEEKVKINNDNFNHRLAEEKLDDRSR